MPPRPFVVALPFVLLAAQSANSAKPVSRVEMELVEGAPVGRIELQVSSPEATRPERRAVTDLLLDVWSDGEDVETLLDQPNARASSASRAAFKARLLIVSSGQIHAGAVASCGTWDLDLAVCDLDCDGGRFGLLRREGRGSESLEVVIGTLPRDIDAGERPGFVISTCGVETMYEIRLAPKTGGKPVELEFVNRPPSD